MKEITSPVGRPELYQLDMAIRVILSKLGDEGTVGEKGIFVAKDYTIQQLKADLRAALGENG